MREIGRTIALSLPETNGKETSTIMEKTSPMMLGIITKVLSVIIAKALVILLETVVVLSPIAPHQILANFQLVQPMLLSRQKLTQHPLRITEKSWLTLKS